MKKQTKKQTISDILYNLEIIRKKVERGKLSNEQLEKLDYDLFIWSGSGKHIIEQLKKDS